MTADRAASRVEHDRLVLHLNDLLRPLAGAAGDPTVLVRGEVAVFLTGELLPHLDSEEEVLRQADDRVETRLLSRAMRAEKRAIAARVAEFLVAGPPWEALAATRALHSLLAFHAAIFDDVLLPALVPAS